MLSGALHTVRVVPVIRLLMAGFRLLKGVVFFGTGAWVLIAFPRLNASSGGVLARLVLSVWRYALTWTAVWAALWWLGPTVLVGSRAGAETALQVLPAVIVAVLVLSLGSLFVIAQTAVSTWGTRAPVVLIEDDEVASTVTRPLVLLVAALLMAGQIPDSASPHHAVDAAIGALMLATARLIPAIATLVPAILQRYTLPRGFPQFVVARERLERELRAGELGLIVYRGPLLGEMARLALRRGDSVAYRAALEAIDQFDEIVCNFAAADARLFGFVTDSGANRQAWLADDLTRALVALADEALKHEVSGRDLNATSRSLAVIAARHLACGDDAGFRLCVDGLAEMATTHVQISSATTNLNSEPVGQLSWLEAEAETADERDAAAHTIAAWALGASYARFHIGVEQHPLYDRSIRNFGPQPPWEEALMLIVDDSGGWLRQWANKTRGNEVEVIAEILAAAEDHADFRGIPRPCLEPTRNTPMTRSERSGPVARLISILSALRASISPRAAAAQAATTSSRP